VSCRQIGLFFLPKSLSPQSLLLLMFNRYTEGKYLAIQHLSLLAGEGNRQDITQQQL